MVFAGGVSSFDATLLAARAQIAAMRNEIFEHPKVQPSTRAMSWRRKSILQDNILSVESSASSASSAEDWHHRRDDVLGVDNSPRKDWSFTSSSPRLSRQALLEARRARELDAVPLSGAGLPAINVGTGGRRPATREEHMRQSYELEEYELEEVLAAANAPPPYCLLPKLG